MLILLDRTVLHALDDGIANKMFHCFVHFTVRHHIITMLWERSERVHIREKEVSHPTGRGLREIKF